MMNNFHIIIPARLESTRLKNKVLLEINGKSIVQLVYEKAQSINPLSVTVATNHKDIFDHIKSLGGEVLMTSSDHQSGMDRVAGDHMGMLATVMNGIALRDALERANVKTRVMSALSISGLVEHFDRRRAIQLLKDGYVVIFTAGTGNPFFTTDTAGCLRAVETQSDIMLKATRVDGVYSADPEKDTNAKFYKNISFEEAISKNLRIMDGTALTLAKDHKLPIKVFNLKDENSLSSIAKGEDIGTLIS